MQAKFVAGYFNLAPNLFLSPSGVNQWYHKSLSLWSAPGKCWFLSRLCRFGLVHMSKVSVCACHMTVMRLKSAFEVCISMLCIAPDVVWVCVWVPMHYFSSHHMLTLCVPVLRCAFPVFVVALCVCAQLNWSTLHDNWNECVCVCFLISCLHLFLLSLLALCD